MIKLLFLSRLSQRSSLIHRVERAWRVERDIFNQIILPIVQLPIADGQRKVLTSQGEAIGFLVRTLLGKRKKNSHRFRTDYPWFGVVALLNLAVFVTLGTILPWSFAGGSNSNPLVRSAATSDCLTYADGAKLQPNYQSTMKNAEVTHSQCWIGSDKSRASCSRLDGISTSRPNLHISRVDKCPFSSNACLDNMRPVQ